MYRMSGYYGMKEELHKSDDDAIADNNYYHGCEYAVTGPCANHLFDFFSLCRFHLIVPISLPSSSFSDPSCRLLVPYLGDYLEGRLLSAKQRQVLPKAYLVKHSLFLLFTPVNVSSLPRLQLLLLLTPTMTMSIPKIL